MTDALWLDDPAARDPAITGGKAAALARLASEHRMPPGYALTTGAFERAEARGVEGVRAPVAEAYEALATSSWGLGESVVGGTVTPDTYVVRKSDLGVVSRKRSEERRVGKECRL